MKAPGLLSIQHHRIEPRFKHRNTADAEQPHAIGQQSACDEADEVRSLLEGHTIDYYETKPSLWGVSGGGLHGLLRKAAAVCGRVDVEAALERVFLQLRFLGHELGIAGAVQLPVDVDVRLQGERGVEHRFDLLHADAVDRLLDAVRVRRGVLDVYAIGRSGARTILVGILLPTLSRARDAAGRNSRMFRRRQRNIARGGRTPGRTRTQRAALLVGFGALTFLFAAEIAAGEPVAPFGTSCSALLTTSCSVSLNRSSR